MCGGQHPNTGRMLMPSVNAARYGAALHYSSLSNQCLDIV